jgi:hypothetical protein
MSITRMTTRLRLRAAVLSVALAAAAPFAGAAEEQKPASTDGRLSASVSPAKAEYTVGEAVTVKFSLKNVSDKPFNLWSRNCSWGHEVYHFRLTLPDGSTKTLSEPALRWDANVPLPMAIEAGKTFTAEFDLKAWAGKALPVGKYKVAGVYRSKNGFKDGKARGFNLGDLWEGELVTDEVTFAIVEK